MTFGGSDGDRGSDRGPVEDLRHHARAGVLEHRDTAGRGARLPGSERRGEDHDAPPAAGADRRDIGTGGDLRRRLSGRSRRGASTRRVRAGRGQPVALADGRGDAASVGSRPRARRRHVPGPADRSVRVRPVEEGSCVLQGQSTEADPHRGSDDQGRSAAPRRADERPRPAHGAGVPRMRGRCPRAWPNGVPVVPHLVGGRGALRPDRDPA